MSKNEKDYSWIKRRNVFEEYVEAEYYNKILKDYIFDKKTDIELFSEWLDTINVKNSKILELGCGTGRVTEALLKKWSEYDELCLLDLSNQMLEYSKKRWNLTIFSRFSPWCPFTFHNLGNPRSMRSN